MAIYVEPHPFHLDQALRVVVADNLRFPVRIRETSIKLFGKDYTLLFCEPGRGFPFFYSSPSKESVASPLAVLVQPTADGQQLVSACLQCYKSKTFGTNIPVNSTPDTQLHLARKFLERLKRPDLNIFSEMVVPSDSKNEPDTVSLLAIFNPPIGLDGRAIMACEVSTEHNEDSAHLDITWSLFALNWFES